MANGKSGSSLSVGDWGSGGIADVGNGLVNGVAGLLNDRGLNNLVDGVDLVGLWDSDWVGDLNSVRLGNMGLEDDFTLNWDWVGDWDIDGDLVDLELGLDAGHLGGDLGVSPDWSDDLLLGDGVSGSWAEVPGCRWDDWGSWGRDGRGSNGDGALAGLGGSGDVGVSWGLLDGLAGDDVLVSGDDLLGSNLNGAGSNDAVVNDGLGNGGSGVKGLVDLSQWGSDGSVGGGSDGSIGWGSDGAVAEGSWGTQKVAGGSAMAQSDEN